MSEDGGALSPSLTAEEQRALRGAERESAKMCGVH
jgi:hypothetical protein